MAKFKLILILLFLLSVISLSAQKSQTFGLAMHGGAGIILKKNMSDEKEASYRKAIDFALETGYAVLEKGGSAMEAVEAAIITLEDNPLFNAGKGAVFTHKGTHTLDASVMHGAELDAGAVAGVGQIKNPIKAAIKVMTHSKHVMLSGTEAEQFAKEQGLKLVEPKYFYTERRWKSLQRAIEREKSQSATEKQDPYKFGTVGVVALDKQGHLAAGTSTGGMTNKKYGRIGDAPIIGAGTYANNKTCAISATGHGEYFIRYTVAHDISALMEYKNMALQEAADLVINKKLKNINAEGGIVGIDRDGNVAFSFNTPGMYRGAKINGKKKIIKIFRDVEEK